MGTMIIKTVIYDDYVDDDGQTTIEVELEGAGFVRVNNACIMNLDGIDVYLLPGYHGPFKLDRIVGFSSLPDATYTTHISIEG